jgi:hypothetical protein
MRVDQVTGQLTVGQLAARTGVHIDTIRCYEREGMLPLPQRTKGEHRRYGPADVDRLLFIRGAQRLGLRLTEIRDLLAVRDSGACPCEPAAGLLGMLSAMPGPDCPDPLPGTWCPPSLKPAERR